MMTYLVKRMIVRFGRRYAYDVSYMLHLLEVTPVVVSAFSAMSKLASYRKTIPLEAQMAAKLLGAFHEDCGPCVQLTVNMAHEAGMAVEQIEAVLTNDQVAMSPETALGYRFALAIINRSSDEDAARDTVRSLYGEAAIVELTLATQVARLFPMIKAGLGYAASCSRITIGDHRVTVTDEAV